MICNTCSQKDLPCLSIGTTDKDSKKTYEMESLLARTTLASTAEAWYYITMAKAF